MIEVGVLAAEVRGPGLADWDAFAQIARGTAQYAPRDTAIAVPAMLTARERRRASPSVKLALGVAEAVVERTGLDPSSLAAVFGSSQGEAGATHELLTALTSPQPFVSPTLFHNSVHNTAAGYWSIGVHGHAPCNSVAAGDFTFGAALASALTFAVVEGTHVLLVAYDVPMPWPLADSLTIRDPFAMALVIGPQSGPAALCRLGCAPAAASVAAVPLRTNGLEPVRHGNPAARSLPLLEAIALGQDASVRLDCAAEAAIEIVVTPC